MPRRVPRSLGIQMKFVGQAAHIREHDIRAMRRLNGYIGPSPEAAHNVVRYLGMYKNPKA
jgi:hypothetical protein